MDAEREALVQAFDSGEWGGYGAVVREFEAAFAAAHDSQFGITTANGTLSLEAALISCGVGAGHEVIVPPISFIATASAVLRVGAIPVFVDIDPGTYNLDPARVSEAITPNTKAVIPVHFAGHPVDLDALLPIAAKAGIAMVEDCAHAHGASWKGKKVGSFGQFGSFSFQQSKNMTAGEGGILTTNDENLADLAWAQSNQGRSRGGAWYQHDRLGTNLRLTSLQAAILNVQLKHLDEQLDRRSKNARTLATALGDELLLKPPAFDLRVTAHGLHLFVMRLNLERFSDIPVSRVADALTAEGVSGVSRYPYPLYRNKLFNNQQHRIAPCPNAEQMTNECIWVTSEVLLASSADLADVVRAIEKLTSSAAELRESAPRQ